MTNAEIIAMIKAEIDMLGISYAEESVFRTVRSETAKEVLLKLSSFLDTLTVENPPTGLDEAANDYCSAYYDWDNEGERREVVGTFKAGAEWREAQMKMPNSTELLSEWNDVKSILKEKDLRGDEWRLAYHAFLFGFTRGLNTKKSNE